MAFQRKKEETPFDKFRREKKKKSESIFSSGGEAIHTLVQAEYAMSGRLGSAETVLVDRNNLLVSKVDMTLRDGTPVEIKSVGAEEIRTTNTPRFEHVAQLSYYVKSQGLTKGYLMYVARENTGLRKVFSIDTNGIYKYVAENSLEYMTLRRGGVDPGKYDFAFHEAVSSGRSNEYYIQNFAKISEEAKLTQSRFKELQRKQAWLQTYRQLASGIYEKASLNRSGVTNAFSTQSEWGSPTQRKKNWKSPEQVQQQRNARRKLDRLAGEYADEINALAMPSQGVKPVSTIETRIKNLRSDLAKYKEGIEKIHIELQNPRSGINNVSIGNKVWTIPELDQEIAKIEQQLQPQQFYDDLTKGPKEKFPNLGKQRYAEAEAVLKTEVEKMLGPLPAKPAKPAKPPKTPKTPEVTLPNNAEVPRAMSATEKLTNIIENRVTPVDVKSQAAKLHKQLNDNAQKKRGPISEEAAEAYRKKREAKAARRAERAARRAAELTGTEKSNQIKRAIKKAKQRADNLTKKAVTQKTTVSPEKLSLAKARRQELSRLRKEVGEDLVNNLKNLNALDPDSITAEVKKLLSARGVNPALVEELAPQISGNAQHHINAHAKKQAYLEAQKNLPAPKPQELRDLKGRLPSDLSDEMFVRARAEVTDALLQKDSAGEILLKNKKGEIVPRNGVPELIPGYQSQIEQITRQKTGKVAGDSAEEINALVKARNPGLSIEELQRLQRAERVRTHEQLSNQVKAFFQVDKAVEGQLTGDYRKTIDVIPDDIEAIRRERATKLINRRYAVVSPAGATEQTPEAPQQKRKLVQQPSLEEIRKDPFTKLPESESQFLKNYLSQESAKSGRPVEQIITDYHEQRVLKGQLHRDVFPEILEKRKADPKFVPTQEWVDSLDSGAFKYGRTGEVLDAKGSAKSQQSFVRNLLNRADRMVEDGQADEFLERRRKSQEFQKRTRKKATFPARTLSEGRSSLVPAERPPVTTPKPSGLTFFDIETSYGRNSTTNSFILEFAGTHLDESVTKDIAQLQGLESSYRQNKAALTKNSLHVQASILNEKALTTIQKAKTVEELIQNKVLGKESFEFYQRRLKEQHALGRNVEVLQLIQEDARDLLQTTGSMKDGKFVASSKYADFKQVETLEEFFESQQKLLSEVDEFFGKAPKTTLAGHNITAFDINKLNTHAENLRADVKNIRGLHTLEQIDTLTSQMSKDFFTRVRESTAELPSELRAAFFERHEVASGDRSKTMRALENLAGAMGFVDEAAQAGAKGAHRAAYDVMQQNIPVYSFMQDFLGRTADEQKEIASRMLQNMVAVDQKASLPHPQVLPDVTAEIPTVHPSTVPREIPKPSKPNIVTEFLKNTADEAEPYLQKAKHWTSQVEGLIDDALATKKGQVHGTYFRRPALAVGGLAVAGLAVAGVALGSAFYSGPKSPMRPPGKVLVHEDARVFPETESDTRIQARAMTDFGSGYQGLKKVLQAPALKTPPIKQLEGKIEQLPGQLLDKEFSLTMPRKSATPTPNSEVITETATVEVELLKNYERAYITNKTETLTRRHKWKNMNADGTKPVFESYKNQVRHHRMSGV